MKKLMIDPPGGWRYGFPKQIPDSQLCRVRHWLVENGYPESEMESYGQHFNYRMWSEDDSVYGRDGSVESCAFGNSVSGGGDPVKQELYITRVTCNRCGYEVEYPENMPDYLKAEWSEVCIGPEASLEPPVFDLCPSCTREVKAWIRNGR